MKQFIKDNHVKRQEDSWKNSGIKMSSSPEANASLVSAQNAIASYGYSFILIFGVVGNVFNICIFLRKTLRSISCNNYFLASAFTNLIALCVGIISTLYISDRPWAMTVLYCRVRGYSLNICQQMSRFFIVMACFDQYARCSANTQLRKFAQVHVAQRYVIPSVVFTWLAIPIHIFILPLTAQKTCAFVGPGALYNSIYGIIWAGFLPPILMLLFSLLTMKNFKSRQDRRRHTHISRTVTGNLLTRRSRPKKVKIRQLLILLLVQVFFYVISGALYTTNLLYLFITANNGTMKTKERLTIEAFITFITEMLRFLSPLLSFYLFLLFSRLFRKQMKLMMIHVCGHCCLLSTVNRIGDGDTGVGHLTFAQSRHEQQTIVQLFSIPTR